MIRPDTFTLTVEVGPPDGPDSKPLLAKMIEPGDA